MKNVLLTSLILFCFAGTISGSEQAKDMSSPFALFGEIEGNVVDCNGGAIPDILVYLRGVSFMARTDEAGSFKLINVPPGDYQLVVDNPGAMQPVSIEVSTKTTTRVTDLTFCPLVVCMDNDRDGHGADPCWLTTVPPGDRQTYGPPSDCVDQNPQIYVGAPEICDGLDNNCNGEADETIRYYLDADGDSFGHPAFYEDVACGGSPSSPNYKANIPPADCDDAKPEVHPGAPEICDGLDNNCNGSVDEECPAQQP